MGCTVRMMIRRRQAEPQRHTVAPRTTHRACHLPLRRGSVTRAEETVLKQNLALLRDSIDKHYADTGKDPESLEALVKKRYMRSVPLDPRTKRQCVDCHPP